MDRGLQERWMEPGAEYVHAKDGASSQTASSADKIGSVRSPSSRAPFLEDSKKNFKKSKKIVRNSFP